MAGRAHGRHWSNAGLKHSIYQWDAILDDGTMFKGGWVGKDY